MNQLVQRYSRKLKNASFEWRLNIRTWDIDRERLVPDAMHYEAMSYPAIWAILTSLNLQPLDVFVDVGCGKGRVVCCAARFNIKRAVGVEINDRLGKIAKENSQRLRKRLAVIEIIDKPAQDTDFSDGTVFFFFNPFGPSTLGEVMSRIQASTAAHPRPVRIIYALPKHNAVIERLGWLRRYDFWPSLPDLQMDYSVSFWKSQ